MSRSLNEIEAQAKRAARGAGLSWGMAEEAARATRWLASHDLAGPALLAEVLAKNDGLPHTQIAPLSLGDEWRAPAGELCPIAAGTALNDCADRLGEGQTIRMAEVSCPLMLVPFAAWAAIHLDTHVQIQWQNLQIETDGTRIAVTDPDGDINAQIAATVTCQTTQSNSRTATLPNLRGDVPPDVWAKLDNFAQRTFAPATEASRSLGAGSGLSDND